MKPDGDIAPLVLQSIEGALVWCHIKNKGFAAVIKFFVNFEHWKLVSCLFKLHSYRIVSNLEIKVKC